MPTPPRVGAPAAGARAMPARSRPCRRVWAAVAGITAAGILVGCFLPRLPEAADSTLALDKVAHLVSFAVLAFAWRRAGARLTVVLVGAALLAALTEVGQALFLRTRSGEWADAGADLLGALLGAVAARRVAT